MAEGTGEPEGGPGTSSRPTVRPRPASVSRPERPEMSDRTPAPLGRHASLPRSLRRARTLWYLSVAMTFFTALTMFLTRQGIASYLADLLHGEDPTVATARFADQTPLIVYTAIALLLFLVALEGLLARVLTWPRQWPRLLMGLVGVLHVAVACGCALVVPLQSWQGWLVMATLLAGTLSVVLASLRGFAPSMSRWIREQREADGRIGAELD